jgi:hypothetical protein
MFWLNVTNIALGVATLGSVLVAVVAAVREITERLRLPARASETTRVKDGSVLEQRQNQLTA